jgi:small subunit ribosomal protein S17
MDLRKTKKVEKTGVVLSDRMDKSRIVLVERKAEHAFYKKFVRKPKKIMAHDESNISNEGDIVKIIKCRPISKRKKWSVREVIAKGEQRQNGASEVSPHSS